MARKPFDGFESISGAAAPVVGSAVRGAVMPVVITGGLVLAALGTVYLVLRRYAPDPSAVSDAAAGAVDSVAEAASPITDLYQYTPAGMVYGQAKKLQDKKKAEEEKQEERKKKVQELEEKVEAQKSQREESGKTGKKVGINQSVTIVRKRTYNHAEASPDASEGEKLWVDAWNNRRVFKYSALATWMDDGDKMVQYAHEGGNSSDVKKDNKRGIKTEDLGAYGAFQKTGVQSAELLASKWITVDRRLGRTLASLRMDQPARNQSGKDFPEPWNAPGLTAKDRKAIREYFNELSMAKYGYGIDRLEEGLN